MDKRKGLTSSLLQSVKYQAPWLRLEPLESRCTPTSLPEGFVESFVATDLQSPIALDVATDGRVFITEQTGALRVVENNVLLDKPFVTLDVDSYFERGLLGVQTPPNFPQDPYVYVYYNPTHPEGTPATGRLSRFRADGNLAIPGSEEVLFEVPNLPVGNHLGGAIAFGPDGKLYLGVGDNSIPDTAQDLTTLKGKILRLNPDGSIPEDNPFFDRLEGDLRAIWAYGVRNPFTFTFQPDTGRFFINDVGEAFFEEVNEGIPGANYGWAEVEGVSGDPQFTDPILSLPHADSPALENGSAIAGGSFYNPMIKNFPDEFEGQYFFADFVINRISTFDPATGEVEVFAEEVDFPVAMEVAPDGTLYYLQRGVTNLDAIFNQQIVDTGALVQVRFAPTSRPEITMSPQDRLGFTGGSETFTVRANGPGTITYQWQRNGVDIPGATTPDLSVENLSLPDDGARFRAIISNEFGSVESAEAVLTVTANQPPRVTLTTTAPDNKFIAGETYTLSAVAIDPETGELSPEALTWQVDYLTGPVTRPGLQPTSGRSSVEFTVPSETPFFGTNVRYRVIVTATDSFGLSTTATQDLFPVVSRTTLQSNVPVEFQLDGTPVQSPFQFEGVAGVTRAISAPEEVVSGGQTFGFESWSDGGEREHRFPTPTTDSILEAVYSPLPFEEPSRLPTGTAFVLGSGPNGSGTLTLYGPAGESILSVTPFDSPPPGGIHGVATDLTGDGVVDLVAGTGWGVRTAVNIFDGTSGSLIQSITPFEDTFTGGVYLSAGDVTGDGVADLVIAAGPGGGARVQVIDGVNSVPIADFFAIEDPEHRGGARVAVGYLDSDVFADLIVTTASGGPRIAGYRGSSLAEARLEKLFADFFAFEPTDRNGTQITLGDINGDNHAELIVGGGPLSGPRIMVLDGLELLNSDSTPSQAPLANFFAWDPSTSTGAQVVARDLDGDPFIDLLVVTSSGEGSTGVSWYSGEDLHQRIGGAPLDLLTELGDDIIGSIFIG